jgi:hypothetical protein
MTTRLVRERSPLLPEVSPRVSLHLLDDDGLLFDAAERRLYALNTAATFVWCCLEEAFGWDETLKRLERGFGFSRAEADAHLAGILAEWRELGLLGESPPTSRAPPPDPSPQGVPRYVNNVWGTGPVYRLLDLHFSVRGSPTTLVDDLVPLLEPLRVAPLADEVLLLDLVEGEQGLAVINGERTLARCARRDELVPLAKGSLVQLALERSGDFLGLHAASASLGGRCVLLPGVSGSGKSTLAGALAARGIALLGDDNVVLAAETLEARPVPFGICLKQDGWDLHRAAFPFLDTLTVYRRFDGKRLRYIIPPGNGALVEPDHREPVGAIVFPCRTGQDSAEVVPIPRTQALARLLNGCCPLGPGLDHDKVAHLVAWARSVYCGELRFGPLGAAVDALIRLRSCFP